ncbi:MAG TPA: hypothetical protein DCY94_02550 [Firmicutes bacterium]|nr:hypothetical protein [Bacillota bacterium]
MNIKLSSELRDELLNMCRRNKSEVGGYILGYIKEGDFYAQEIEPYRKDIIAHSSKGHLSFNKNYIHDTIFRLRHMKNGGIYVRFHTHPTSKNSAVMSDSDEVLLSRIQILASKICKNGEISVCEGIVSANEITFYT